MNESAITVWRDGTWKSWRQLDAHYAENDPDWILTMNESQILEAMKQAHVESPVTPKRTPRVRVSLEHSWNDWFIGIYFQRYVGAWDLWIHFLPTLSVNIHAED